MTWMRSAGQPKTWARSTNAYWFCWLVRFWRTWVGVDWRT
jgi:hypothetical protein